MTTNQKLTKTAFSELSKILKSAQEMRAVAKLGPRRVEWVIDCRVVEDSEMIRFNRTYRKKAKTTDILSFPSGEPFFGEGFLGTLVICGSVLKAQAKEEGHSEKDELRVLLVHGVLHLLGLDHERGNSEAIAMQKLESGLLKKSAPVRKNSARPHSLITRQHSGKK